MRAKLWFGAATAAFAILGASAGVSAQESDPPGDASTQARLVPGEAADGEISPAGDADWYRMRVELGQRYNLTLDGVAGEDGQAIDTALGVYDAEGVQLAFNDDAGGTLNSALRYAPAQSGEVFVEARGFSDQASGRYRLSVSAAPTPADDAGNDAHTRARARPGAAINGNIEYEGDIDWYRLSARTGQRYRIALATAEGEGGLPDPLLRIVAADGSELAVSDDSEGSLNSALDFTPQSNGDVFIEASGYGGNYTGAYALSVAAERAPRDNISADVYTHGRIAVGGSVSANLDFAGDSDWYRIRLDQGQSYRLTLIGAGDAAVGDPMIRLYDRRGEEVASDDDGGEGFNAYLEFTAPADGVYYVEARGFGDDATGGYRLTALAGDIPNGPDTDVNLSADGDYREGVLAPGGDHDWYGVSLKAGQGMRVALASAQTADALADPLLAIHGADGVEIMRDDDGGEGLDAWLEFQAPADGMYYIVAQGFSDDAQGRYLLTLTAGEIGASGEGAEHIAPNGEGRTSLIGGEGDVDWFGIEMIEGRPYRITLEGAEPGPVPDPVLTLYDSQGKQVAADDDGGAGANAYLTFISPTGGTYFAAASGFGAATGRYLLRVTDTDVPGNAGTDETLDASGDERLSRIDNPGDVDDFRVDLEAGVRYTIEVKGAGDNPLADPFLSVLDSGDTRVTSDDDSGPGLDARVRFTPEQSGAFFIQASGLGGSTGWYQITIARQ